MKRLTLSLLASLLVLSSCSATAMSQDDLNSMIEQKDKEIENLKEQIEAQQAALQEKTDTINEQHEIIENQHARIEDMIDVLYDRENDYEFSNGVIESSGTEATEGEISDAIDPAENPSGSIADSFVSSSSSSQSTKNSSSSSTSSRSSSEPISNRSTNYVGIGPYTVENTSDVYSHNSGKSASETYRYSSDAGQSKAIISESKSITEHNTEDVLPTGGKKVSMQMLYPTPQVKDLSGDKQVWAQKIVDALLAGQTSVDVDPDYFGVNSGSLSSPQALEIEKAVYFTLYPQTSYFNNGMVFNKGHMSMDGNGNITSFTLFLKDYKSSYVTIIDDWMKKMLTGIDTNTTEMDAYQMIHDRICQYVTYSPDALHNSLTTVIATGQGVCNDYAEMVVSLCRHIGIPARYITGFYNGNYHAWVQVNLDGKWYYSDPTNDDQSYGIIRNFYLSENLFDGYKVQQVDS